MRTSDPSSFDETRLSIPTVIGNLHCCLGSALGKVSETCEQRPNGEPSPLLSQHACLSQKYLLRCLWKKAQCVCVKQTMVYAWRDLWFAPSCFSPRSLAKMLNPPPPKISPLHWCVTPWGRELKTSCPGSCSTTTSPTKEPGDILHDVSVNCSGSHCCGQQTPYFTKPSPFKGKRLILPELTVSKEA